MDKVRGHDCPLCGRERWYINRRNAEKLKDKTCKSCSNSISQGGVGWSPLCIDCGVEEKDPKYSSLCKTCHAARSKKYHKEVYRWAKYGLDGPMVMELCAICGREDDLCVDHCHDTNVVRGVLCRPCNMAIGLLQDSPHVIKSAYKYLKERKLGFE